jgi:hypothetical protein
VSVPDALSPRPPPTLLAPPPGHLGPEVPRRSGEGPRVWLTGRISSGGSTFTIADEIMPALKQFRSVRWVKIYDQDGRTERPFGHSDSIPLSLEP